MKQNTIRWLDHARENLRDREVRESEVLETIDTPDFRTDGRDGRIIYMRYYPDEILGQQMLLRVIVEEHSDEILVVTIYKTSRDERYTKELK